MAKNISSKSRVARTETRTARIDFGSLDPNELKTIVRDGLVTMNMAEREEFIQMLEAKMRQASLNMRAYLVPLGIPGRSPEDLTPTEVGHLIRFLKFNVPRAMPAVISALSGYGVFAEKTADYAGPMAA